jgi:hypothetical protein
MDRLKGESIAFLGEFAEAIQSMIIAVDSPETLAIGQAVCKYWPDVPVAVDLLVNRFLVKLETVGVFEEELQKIHWLFPRLAIDALKNLVYALCRFAQALPEDDADRSLCVWAAVGKSFRHFDAQTLPQVRAHVSRVLIAFLRGGAFGRLASASDALTEIIRTDDEMTRGWFALVLGRLFEMPLALQIEWTALIADGVAVGTFPKDGIEGTVANLVAEIESVVVAAHRQNLVFLLNCVLTKFPEFVGLVVQLAEVIREWYDDASALLRDNIASYFLGIAVLCDGVDEETLAVAFAHCPPEDAGEGAAIARKLIALQPKIGGMSDQLKVAYIQAVARMVIQPTMRNRVMKVTEDILDGLRATLRGCVAGDDQVQESLEELCAGSADKLEKLELVFS